MEAATEIAYPVGLMMVLPVALLAGIMNAIAGGGTLLTFPILVFVGLPPVIANASSSLSQLPGYFTSSAGFREELEGYDTLITLRYCGVALLGALCGSTLLVITPGLIFDYLVPVLLFGATALFGYHRTLIRWLNKTRGRSAPATVKPVIPPYWSMFAIAIYGGYFGGGLGILILAFFAIIGIDNIHVMNGLKSLISFVIALVAVMIFGLAGAIDWSYAVPMMAVTSLGGYMGARMSKILSQDLIRQLITTIGMFVTIAFIWRLIP